MLENVTSITASLTRFLKVGLSPTLQILSPLRIIKLKIQYVFMSALTLHYFGGFGPSDGGYVAITDPFFN